MMWPMHDGWGWGWGMTWAWLGMLVLAGLIAWAVVRLTVGEPGRNDERRTPSPDALTLLEQRYARGEISDEQFEAMRQRLTPRSIPYDMT